MIKKNVNLAGTVITMDNSSYVVLKDEISNINLVKINNPVEIYGEPQVPTYKYYLFLGWVIKTKGIEELLAAWKEAKIDATLRIVGPYQNSYLDCLKQAGLNFHNIVFEGEKNHDEAMEILSGAEALILPSYSEGCPYSILEAMTFKKPIIATKVGDIPKMLNDECGILIDVHNSVQLCEAIIKLEQEPNLKRILGVNAYMKVVEEYSIKKILAQYRNSWENKSITL